ncbi:MAG: hypothetical protein AB7F96_13250 [Beijerinckiaceae bacterium]
MSTQPLQNVNPSSDLVWTGASGIRYQFENYALGTARFFEKPGVYVFSRQFNGLFYAVYVGETDNFARRLSNELAAHHAWDSIARAGATHISAMVVVGGLAERLKIETDLRHGLNPPCNRQ